MDVKFNATIHQTDDFGDPLRNDDGSVRLRTNWKDLAVDRQGRKFNPNVHGEKHELDGTGFLKVRRRDAKAGDVTIGRAEAFIQKNHEAGYADYLMNDDGGRMEQFKALDWEVVIDKETGKPAKMNVGQARGSNTTAFHMRKPLEWYEEDQRKKHERTNLELKQKTSPKEEDGQYEADRSSPLR